MKKTDVLDKGMSENDPFYVPYCSHDLTNLDAREAGHYKECSGCPGEPNCKGYLNSLIMVP